ncbi:MAG: hypothetical protein ABR611_16615, partial [Chthoniobacterales bacterium]
QQHAGGDRLAHRGGEDGRGGQPEREHDDDEQEHEQDHAERRPAAQVLLGPDDAPSILLDPSRTFRDFGEVSFTPLDEIVTRTVAYYREFGVKGGYTHLSGSRHS